MQAVDEDLRIGQPARALLHFGARPVHATILGFLVGLAGCVLLFRGSYQSILGGMLSVLVTDFLQFLVMSAGLLVVTFAGTWAILKARRWI